MATKVQVLKEVSINHSGGWKLCFQWCRYCYDKKAIDDHEYPICETGYRFIWRYPDNNNLQAARGQARLPSVAAINQLTAMAIAAGWGNLEATAEYAE